MGRLTDIVGTTSGSFSVTYPGQLGNGLLWLAHSGYVGFDTNTLYGPAFSLTPPSILFNTTASGATDWALSFGTVHADINVTVDGSTFNAYVQSVGVGSTQRKQCSYGLYGFNGAVPTFVVGRSAGATVGTYSTALTNEVLGVISFQGSDGTTTGFVGAAKIKVTASGTWSGATRPVDISIGTNTTPSAVIIHDDGTMAATAATASQNDNTTKLSNTAYVDRAVGNIIAHQVAHGFSVGMPIARNSGAWVQADQTVSTKMATAVVVASSGADDFVAQDIGSVTLTTGQWDARTGLSGGLVDQEYYWLGAAGLLTATQPATGYVQLIGQATSTTVMMLEIGDSFSAAATNSGYSEGTSFPASPVTNQKYYRTDKGLLCYYDGTQWLTTQIFEQPITVSGIAASGPGLGPYMVLDQTVFGYYIIECFHRTNIASGTSNSTNHWQVQLMAETGNSSPVDTQLGSTIDTGTAPDTVAQWILHSFSAINTKVASNIGIIYLKCTKFNTIGTLSCAASVRYRLVVT